MMPDSSRAKAWALRMSGLTYAEIGRQLGFSRQRAQQLVKPPPAVVAAVQARAHSKCEACGVELSQGHVHHKQASGLTPDTYNELENLEYLCVRCHLGTHLMAGGFPAGFYRPRGHKNPRRPRVDAAPGSGSVSAPTRARDK